MLELLENRNLTNSMKPNPGPQAPRPKVFSCSRPGEEQADEDDEADFAQVARKKLGIPEYDPNASLLSSLPKILLLVSNPASLFLSLRWIPHKLICLYYLLSYSFCLMHPSFVVLPTCRPIA